MTPHGSKSNGSFFLCSSRKERSLLVGISGTLSIVWIKNPAVPAVGLFVETRAWNRVLMTKGSHCIFAAPVLSRSLCRKGSLKKRGVKDIWYVGEKSCDQLPAHNCTSA